jgi:hypothetical protein
MKTPVFLKANRVDADTEKCLSFWLSVFRNSKYHQIYFVCDNPQLVESLRTTGLEILPTDVRASELARRLVGEPWFNVSAAHFSTFTYAERSKASYFWNIDADDTMFLGLPYQTLTDLLHVEAFSKLHNLDLISLDFYYSLLPKHWSFGVAFCRNSIAEFLQKLSVVTLDRIEESIRARGFPKVSLSIDQLFDYQRHTNSLKIRSFIFNNRMFFHKHPQLPSNLGRCLYRWEEGKLWNQSLDEDVVQF